MMIQADGGTGEHVARATQECSPQELQAALAAGACEAFDVREPAEVTAERIRGLRHVPLSSFDRHLESLDIHGPIYVVCRSGNRAATAAQKLRARGHPHVTVLTGGILAWVAAGLPVERSASPVWSLERQVRFAAGSLVLMGTLLAVFLHPAFIALSGFVGAGLIFAAVSDTCGMAMLLARMPWNQKMAAICDSRAPR